MTYEDFAALLKETADETLTETKEAGSIILGRKIDVSNIFDSPFPQIFFTEIGGNNGDYKSETEINRVTVGFIYEDDQSNTPEEREVIFGNAEYLMRVFMDKLRAKVVDFDGMDYVQILLSFASSASGWGGRLVIRSQKEC